MLNLAPRMVGESSSSEGDVVVDVSSLVLGGSKRGVRVKRMTASGIDVTKTSKVTWAGQSYSNGSPSGRLVTESLQPGGFVTVRASEGVIVFL